MAAVEETAISPLPRPNWHDGAVEEVEGITARLGARWLVHFCSGERARRWRRSVRNGGRLRLGAARGEGEGEANGAGECVGQALAFFWSADARCGGIDRA